MNNKNPLMLLLILFSILTITSCSSEEGAPVEALKERTVTSVKTPLKSIETEILDLVNNHRTGKGLSKLRKLEIIRTQTHEHTDYMIANDTISHDNFLKRQVYLERNAKANRVGENVAYGYRSAKSVVKAWLKSESHRRNIEGDFNHFNITAKQSKNGKWYYTNIFVRK